jgi:hypothetical protein
MVQFAYNTGISHLGGQMMAIRRNYDTKELRDYWRRIDEKLGRRGFVPPEVVPAKARASSSKGHCCKAGQAIN